MPIGNGIAVRAKTSASAFDGVNALQVNSEAGHSRRQERRRRVVKQLREAELPLAVPAVPGKTIEQEVASTTAATGPRWRRTARSSPSRVARPRSGLPRRARSPARSWSPRSSASRRTRWTFHVTEGGRSFGRRLFFDASEAAAEASKAIGKPVKLMWDRAATPARVAPAAVHHPHPRRRSEDAVASFELRYTSVATEIDPGLSEAITVAVIKAPRGNLRVSESFFGSSQVTPYDFGANTRVINEVDMRFNTGWIRNVYGPDTATTRELMIDQIAAGSGRTRQVPNEFIKTERCAQGLNRVANEAEWGKTWSPAPPRASASTSSTRPSRPRWWRWTAEPETVNLPDPAGRPAARHQGDLRRRPGAPAQPPRVRGGR